MYIPAEIKNRPRPSIIACHCIGGMGRNQEAMQYAYEAYERHDAFLIHCFNVWPDNKYLIAIPEFSEFLESTNLDFTR